MSYITPTLNWNASNYYNYSDFNRVENNASVVSALMNAYGYGNTLVTPITTRTVASLDFYDSLNRIENNIAILQQPLGYVPIGWIGPVTSWTYGMPFDYITANRLEQNIDSLYTNINNVITELRDCGSSNVICGTDSTYL
jgi:hypothetical protein